MNFIIARPWRKDATFPSEGNMCTYMIQGQEMFSGTKKYARSCLEYVRNHCDKRDRNEFKIVEIIYKVIE